MSNKNIYIPVLTPEITVKKNPRIYWGVNNPSSDDVNSAMAKQIKIECGSEAVVTKFNQWNIVASFENWLKPLVKSNTDIARIFENALRFEDGNPRSLRTEYFLHLVSERVAIWFNEDLLQVKGEVDSALIDYMQAHYQGFTCVCYIASSEYLSDGY